MRYIVEANLFHLRTINQRSWLNSGIRITARPVLVRRTWATYLELKGEAVEAVSRLSCLNPAAAMHGYYKNSAESGRYDFTG
jgi:hypothetical protein